MTRWERFMLTLRLASLRGQDQTLHSRIASGYARGDYQSAARARQRDVRQEIARIEATLKAE